MNALILLLTTTTFSRLIPNRHTAFLEKLLRYIILTLTVVYFVTLFLYLLFPSYVDHVEPTLADLGMLFRKGEAVYAWPPIYSLHGLLYGPGLTELQAAAQLLPVPLLISSKLPGVLPAAILALLFLRVTSSLVARGYILFFFLFADASLWNRADPILGLAAYVALLLTERKQMAHILLFVLLGVIAGICSSLKLHGALYIVPAFVMALSRQDKWFVPFALFVIFAAATLLASFAPPQVDLSNFMTYMSLASKHTIVPYMIFNNLCYLATLTLPLAWVLKSQKSLPLRPLLLCVILGVELIIVVIGAKDGAGTHHLLPVIFINAFLVDHFIREAGEQRDHSGSNKAWYFMFIVGALAVAFGLFKFNRTLASNWTTAREATTELSAFAREFSALHMGVTDRSNYDSTSLRPMLAQMVTQQIEFAAFMDTHYSGLSDAPLVEKMRNCSIAYWVLPAKGEPFTLPNFYTRKPLFSTELRSTFLDKYSKTREGKFFHVYKCRSNDAL